MIRLRPSGVDEVLIKRVQDWYEPGPGVFIQSLTASFSPAMLFTGSTTGVWYDPSDYTTLYQDAAGTTPVTAVEQPVGLMLDKSKGLALGPELVTNGDFSNGTTGWSDITASLSVAAGEGVVTSASSFGYVRQTLTTVVGRTYQFTLNARVGTTSKFTFAVAGGAVAAETTSATTVSLRCVYTATSTSTNIWLQVNSAGTAFADNISVRELPGNHAFNSSGNSANFPVLSARYNLLTKTEQFDDAVWSKTSFSVTPNATIAPDGTTTADLLTPTNNANLSYVIQSTAATSGQIKLSYYVKPNTGRYFVISRGPYVVFDYVVFDLVSGTVTTQPTYSGSTASISSAQNGYFFCTLTSSQATTIQAFSVSDSASGLGSGTGGSVYVWGADLRVANDALNQPAYQRVNTSTDYDTVGFKPYLRFNGTNQWLQTNSIDFSYGDKMFVSAGVRKLSDAATGCVFDFGDGWAGKAGAFGFYAPSYVSTPGGKYYVGLKGTGLNNSDYATYAAPTTNVFATSLDIAQSAAGEISTKINGASISASTASGDAGGGNFGNYSMVIGKYVSFPGSTYFNGRLYGAVVAGKQASDAEITSTETYLNQKTGAF